MNYSHLFTEKGLSLERLNTLVEIARAGNIAAAVPRSKSISGSNFDTRRNQYSRQLSELEKYFGVELKKRDGKYIKLTPNGEKLARISEDYLRQLEQFHRNCVDPKFVRIGAGDSLLQWVLAPRIFDIDTLSEDVSLQLLDLQNIVMAWRLSELTLDFALLRSDLVEGNIEGESLGRFGYSLFIPKELCPEGDKRPSGKLISELPLAIQGDNTKFQARFEEIAVEKNWDLKVKLYGESFPQLARLLGSGNCAVVLPDIVKFGMDFQDGWSVPIEELDEMKREIYLAWNSKHLKQRPFLEPIKEELIEKLRFNCSR